MSTSTLLFGSGVGVIDAHQMSTSRLSKAVQREIVSAADCNGLHTGEVKAWVVSMVEGVGCSYGRKVHWRQQH